MVSLGYQYCVGCCFLLWSCMLFISGRVLLGY